MVSYGTFVAGTKQQRASRSAPPPLVYGGNAKHQEPWQRGRKGSLCSKRDLQQAQELLDASVLVGKKRWATDGERAFSGKQDGHGKWHGYPVGWLEVPTEIRNEWQDAGRVKRRSITQHWRHHGK
jgi:hypothetical protein